MWPLSATNPVTRKKANEAAANRKPGLLVVFAGGVKALAVYTHTIGV